MSSEAGAAAVAKYLQHYGVKGMRWGVRKDRVAHPVTAETGTTITGKAHIHTDGGKHHQPHADAVTVEKAHQKLKFSGPHALSNDELRALASRMQLEQQVRQLTKTRPKGPTHDFVKEALKDPKKTEQQLRSGKELIDFARTGIAKRHGK